MDNFKTFLEDLASGRPAKKPVSSNLLKQRAKDNEKALKSGFMKMPDYVKKKFNEEEEVKPHKMYKGDKVVVAKNKAEHDKLNKQGYKEMKEQSIFEISDTLKKRYLAKAGKQVTGTEKMKDYQLNTMDNQNQKPASLPREKFTKADKEFVKNKYDKDTLKRRKGMAQARSKLGEAKKPVVHSDKPDSLKMVKIKYNKPIKTKVTDIGPGGKEVVRKNWSESTRDKYNPVISDKRNKEKMAKVGLPAGKGPLVQEEKQKGVDGKVCWDGYKRMGTKKKGGKTVDNCVKAEDFVLDAFENYYLTELSPKTISSYQKKAGAQYRSLRKTTPSHQDSENAYHQGYTSDKEYDKQHDDRDKMKKRGKGLALSKGKGVQKEEAQMQLVTNLDLDESIANLVRRGVGKVQKAISDAEKRTGYKVDPAKRNIPNPVSGDNIAKRLYGKSQKKR